MIAKPRAWVELSVLLLSSAAFALGVLWWRSRSAEGLVAYDFYGQFYPYMVHALRSLRSGGGLLWNPYQDCGQAFFGNTQTGLLYPINVVFAALPREPALLASVIINLAIAGAGMFLLCRSMGVRRTASLCGALAFQLGWAASNMAAWSPTHMAPFAWLPVALWRTERLIRAPNLRRGLWLAVVLAIQILPGFPQTVFFTYQLIGLRVAWCLLFGAAGSARVLLPPLAVGLVAPLLLDAVQLLPAIETARESVRKGALTAAQLGPGFSWDALRRNVIAHLGIPGNALLLLLALYGLVAARQLRRGADAAYYGLVTALYFVLSLGPGSILFGLYVRVPGGGMFRGSGRLLWLTSVGVSVLTAFACEALLAGETHRSRRRRYALAAGMFAAAVLLYVGAAGKLRAVDVAMMAIPFGLALAPSYVPLARGGPVLLPALLIFDTLIAGRPPLFGLRQGDVYGVHADVFDFIRARQTPQDRVLIVGGQPALELMAKAGTLFAIPNVHDYDPLAANRYAEYYTFLRTGHAMRDFDDWYWIFDKLLPPTLQRPLFDLTAARYVIVTHALDTTARALGSGLRLLRDEDGVRVYENEQAAPRARFVGRVSVRGEDGVLPALASGAIDTRNAAVVSEADRAKLHGTGGDGTGTVEFAADDPERVVLRVHATAPGFLLLADEYFPGWTATVNSEPRLIVRANHTFRLVEVPAGDSEVIFAFRPISLRVGAVITLAALGVFLVLWRRSSAHYMNHRVGVTAHGTPDAAIRTQPIES